MQDWRKKSIYHTQFLKITETDDQVLAFRNPAPDEKLSWWPVISCFLYAGIATLLFFSVPIFHKASEGTVNFWLFIFVQHYWWDILAFGIFNCVMKAGIPGLPMRYQIIVSIGGLCTAPVYRLIVHFANENLDNNYFIGLFQPLTCTWIFLPVYLYYALSIKTNQYKFLCPLYDMYATIPGSPPVNSQGIWSHSPSVYVRDFEEAAGRSYEILQESLTSIRSSLDSIQTSTTVESYRQTTPLEVYQPAYTPYSSMSENLLASQDQYEQRVVRHPILQVWLTFTYVWTISGIYIALEIFADQFSQSTNQTSRTLWYIAFLGLNIFFKVVMKYLGLYLDAGKYGTCSFFFLNEIVVVLFYYVFYRGLFESVHNVTEFIAMQAFHVVQEWALYPLRASESFYNFYIDRLRKWRNLNPILDVVIAPVSLKLIMLYRDWASFIVLDYSIRVCIMLHTAVWYIVYFTFLRYGYNRNCYKLYKDVSDAEYHSFIMFTVASCGIEIFNTWLIEQLAFKKFGINVFQHTKNLFSNKLFWYASFSCQLQSLRTLSFQI